LNVEYRFTEINHISTIETRNEEEWWVVVAIKNRELNHRLSAGWTIRPRAGWQPIGGFPNPLGKRVWIEEADDLFLYRPAHRGIKPGGDLLGGVSALQETDLTGPTSIFKLLP